MRVSTLNVANSSLRLPYEHDGCANTTTSVAERKESRRTTLGSPLKERAHLKHSSKRQSDKVSEE
jgi:hypothetical protein